MASISEIQVTGDVYKFGLRPELFIVPAGSYISNASYGSGVTGTGTYINSQLVSGDFEVNGTHYTAKTQCDIRQVEGKINFNLVITLDRSVDFPVLLGGEVRIRALQKLASEPTRYSKVLPETFGTPFFREVEILRVGPGNNWIKALPLLSDRVMSARLLYDGTLALVVTNNFSSPPISAGLQIADLNSYLGGVNEGPLMIIVRGAYDPKRM